MYSSGWESIKLKKKHYFTIATSLNGVQSDPNLFEKFETDRRAARHDYTFLYKINMKKTIDLST